jgi:hypothetical protein
MRGGYNPTMSSIVANIRYRCKETEKWLLLYSPTDGRALPRYMCFVACAGMIVHFSVAELRVVVRILQMHNALLMVMSMNFLITRRYM